MPLTTIRSTLFTLIGSLGAVILVLVALQLAELNALRQRANEQFDSNLSRDEIARSALALARERDAYYLALTLGRPVNPATALEADRRVAVLIGVIDQITQRDGTESEAVLEMLSYRLPAVRQAARDALALPVHSAERTMAAEIWFHAVSGSVADLLAYRIYLLSQSESISTHLFGLYYLRTNTLTLLDELMKDAALLEVDAARQIAMGTSEQMRVKRPETSRVVKAASEVAWSAGPFEDVLGSLGGQGLGPGLKGFDADAYTLAQHELRVALATGGNVVESSAHWRRVSQAAILQLDELQRATFRLTQSAVSALAQTARRSILIWSLVLYVSAALVAISGRVLLEWVVGPLERMRAAMLQLAVDNIDVALPKQSGLREIAAMDDALRAFRANATLRHALQSERLKLHGRLEETYGHLKTDLEAAAVIQASLLPQQAQLGNISLSSYFRPSHFLAGDTFDVLQQPDGRVIVFQIDVAGHGAAAALVSVASKYTVAQAILQRRPGGDLAELAAEINREWPSDLPYFTLVLAEIDPTSGEGVLVQAGHPSPLLLQASGELAVLGRGGLPVGVLPHATYEAVPFAFGPGDRLLIATDGVHEMADARGELFSEERMQNLIRSSGNRTTEQILADLDTSLRDWRGDDSLDDDVTIVILERKQAREHH